MKPPALTKSKDIFQGFATWISLSSPTHKVQLSTLTLMLIVNRSGGHVFEACLQVYFCE